MDINKLNRTDEVLDALGEMEYHYFRICKIILGVTDERRALSDAHGQYSNGTEKRSVPKAGSNYPCGPCLYDGPVMCHCGTVVTEDNAKHQQCPKDEDGYDCEICSYCSNARCPHCGAHVCCGGCV